MQVRLHLSHPQPVVMQLECDLSLNVLIRNVWVSSGIGDRSCKGFAVNPHTNRLQPSCERVTRSKPLSQISQGAIWLLMWARKRKTQQKNWSGDLYICTRVLFCRVLSIELPHLYVNSRIAYYVARDIQSVVG